ncbi:MAG: hypothetical protein ACP5IZ_05455 [Thermoprotei archaeon]
MVLKNGILKDLKNGMKLFDPIDNMDRNNKHKYKDRVLQGL